MPSQPEEPVTPYAASEGRRSRQSEELVCPESGPLAGTLPTRRLDRVGPVPDVTTVMSIRSSCAMVAVWAEVPTCLSSKLNTSRTALDQA